MTLLAFRSPRLSHASGMRRSSMAEDIATELGE